MWVFEEDYTVPDDSSARDKFDKQPHKLTEIINTTHQNVKYLPEINLPENLVANPNIEEVVEDATILIFNLPHQFMGKTLDQIKGRHLPYARGISCVKGVEVTGNGVTLFSDIIMEELGIYCGALSGANIAKEVAAEKFCETTIGYDPPPSDFKVGGRSGSEDISKVNEQKEAGSDPSHAKLQPMPPEYVPVDAELMTTLFYRPYFHVNISSDVAGVALAGALKNIVALGAGFVAGKGWGDNAKAAIMRIGILEMIEFGRLFFPDSVNPQSFTRESAGVADLITSCNAGRNYTSAKMSVEKGITVEEIEKTEMNGQKLQGASTARCVHEFLAKEKKADKFPLFEAVYSEF